MPSFDKREEPTIQTSPLYHLALSKKKKKKIKRIIIAPTSVQSKQTQQTTPNKITRSSYRFTMMSHSYCIACYTGNSAAMGHAPLNFEQAIHFTFHRARSTRARAHVLSRGVSHLYNAAARRCGTHRDRTPECANLTSATRCVCVDVCIVHVPCNDATMQRIRRM